MSCQSNTASRIFVALWIFLSAAEAFLHPRSTTNNIFFATTVKSSPSRSSQHSNQNYWPLLNGSKGPLGRIGDLFEEAAASTMDYLLMQPKRDVPSDLRRVRTQFIAALGDPEASSGATGAEQWGIWRVDPGPRGVHLSSYDAFLAKRPNAKAPAGWTFDPDEFWIEEYGRIMEKPDFPCPSIS